MGNVSLDWLATGVGDSTPAAKQQSDHKYASIPHHAIIEQCGEVGVESEIAHLSLNSKWLEQKGLAPADMRYSHMPDDSMKPTIQEDSLIVVDGSSKLSGDGIYAIMYGHTLTIKRIQAELDGGLFIRNDNKIYSDEHVKAEDVSELSIVGKVIWVGGEI